MSAVAYYRAPRLTEVHNTGPDNALLTVPEACALLRVSRWTLYRLIQQRQLRTVRIGSRRLIEAAAIREVIATLSKIGER